ncbi:MAG: YjfB family protein [Lachnospiraceae bacterium]|nr:YjfB family protein [Lachnospiraceae bacterium]
MDIAALSMSLAQANLQTSVGFAMMGKTLDVQEDMGASLTQMVDAAAMERSVNPSVGSTLDISI